MAAPTSARSGLVRFMLVVLCAQALDAAAADEQKTAPDKPKRPSTLAPVIPYLDIWQHVHSKDTGVPKLLLLLDDAEGDEAPSWYSTAAMHYKDGRSKKAAFIVVKAGKDARMAATRFGLSQIPEGGALFACVPSADGDGYSKQYEGPLSSGGGGERTRAMRAFVDGLLAGIPSEEQKPLPTFPEPTRPRKAAPISLEEFTHESLPVRCYGVQAKPLCVLALLDASTASAGPPELSTLAKRHANDPVSFGWVGAKGDTDFLAAYGVEALPVMLAVKAGKRPRFAKLDGPLTLESMGGFMDTILGGGANFKRISELPDLEPPYLRQKEEV